MSSTRHPPFLRPFQLQEGSFFAQISKIFLAKIRVDKRNMEIWKNVDFQVLKRIIGLNRRKTPGSLKRKVINGDSTEARYCLFFVLLFSIPLVVYIFNAKTLRLSGLRVFVLYLLFLGNSPQRLLTWRYKKWKLIRNQPYYCTLQVILFDLNGSMVR